MVNSLENIDKSKVSADRIEGLSDVIETEIGNTLTGAVSTITTNDLTENKALISNGSGKVAASSVTNTELGYVSGVTSSIQTQLGNKANDSSVVHKTGDETIDGEKTFNKCINRYINSAEPKTDNSWHALDIYDTYTSSGLSTGLDCNMYNSLMFNQLHRSINETNYTSILSHKITEGTTNFYISSSANTEILNTTYATDSTTSNDFATKGWVNNPSTSTNVVHRTGDETITGAKTFTSNIDINRGQPFMHYKTTRTKGVASQNDTISGVRFNDSNDSYIAALRFDYSSDLTAGAFLRVYSDSYSYEGEEGTATLGIFYPSSGNPYTKAPTPDTTTSSSSTRIATTGWVNSTGNNVVHLSGTEEITGSKTFAASPTVKVVGNSSLYYTTNNLTKGTNPSSTHYSGMIFYDKEIGNQSYELGYLMNRVESNGTCSTGIVAMKYSSGSTTGAEIRVEYPKTGSPYATCPDPTDTYSSTSSKQIPTVGFVASNFVNIDGTQTISGVKTFTSDVSISHGNPSLNIINTGITSGTAPSSDAPTFIKFQDKNKRSQSAIRAGYNSNKETWVGLRAYKSNTSSDTDTATFAIQYPASSSPYVYSTAMVRPFSDNNLNLGDSSHRWKQLYAGTTTIATSDERVKQQITDIPDEVLDAWGNVGFCQFKFNDAVEEKGDKARTHTGMIAQRIKEAFEEANIDPFAYGLLCYDEWEAENAVYDEDGNLDMPAKEAGNRYSLRYEECLCMEAAYQRRKNQQLEERIARLEQLLNH